MPHPAYHGKCPGCSTLAWQYCSTLYVLIRLIVYFYLRLLRWTHCNSNLRLVLKFHSWKQRYQYLQLTLNVFNLQLTISVINLQLTLSVINLQLTLSVTNTQLTLSVINKHLTSIVINIQLELSVINDYS